MYVNKYKCCYFLWIYTLNKIYISVLPENDSCVHDICYRMYDNLHVTNKNEISGTILKMYSLENILIINRTCELL